MSPQLVSGMRQLAMKRRRKSSFRPPRLKSFSTGMRRPSWKMSVLAGEMEPGTRPPTSEQCMKVHA